MIMCTTVYTCNDVYYLNKYMFKNRFNFTNQALLLFFCLKRFWNHASTKKKTTSPVLSMEERCKSPNAREVQKRKTKAKDMAVPRGVVG